jgi:hypothetical protein
MSAPEEFIARGILDLVPFWYEADYGPHEHELRVGSRSYRFFTIVR